MTHTALPNMTQRVPLIKKYCALQLVFIHKNKKKKALFNVCMQLSCLPLIDLKNATEIDRGVLVLLAALDLDEAETAVELHGQGVHILDVATGGS